MKTLYLLTFIVLLTFLACGEKNNSKDVENTDPFQTYQLTFSSSKVSDSYIYAVEEFKEIWNSIYVNKIPEDKLVKDLNTFGEESTHSPEIAKDIWLSSFNRNMENYLALTEKAGGNLSASTMSLTLGYLTDSNIYQAYIDEKYGLNAPISDEFAESRLKLETQYTGCVLESQDLKSQLICHQKFNDEVSAEALLVLEKE